MNTFATAAQTVTAMQAAAARYGVEHALSVWMDLERNIISSTILEALVVEGFVACSGQTTGLYAAPSYTLTARGLCATAADVAHVDVMVAHEQAIYDNNRWEANKATKAAADRYAAVSYEPEIVHLPHGAQYLLPGLFPVEGDPTQLSLF